MGNGYRRARNDASDLTALVKSERRTPDDERNPNPEIPTRAPLRTFELRHSRARNLFTQPRWTFHAVAAL